MHSQMVKRTIKTSETHTANVIITIRRIKHDINGNGRFIFHVWIDRQNDYGGNLWSPKVKGYRMKDEGYIITSSNGRVETDDLSQFIKSFEKSVQA